MYQNGHQALLIKLREQGTRGSQETREATSSGNQAEEIRRVRRKEPGDPPGRQKRAKPHKHQALTQEPLKKHYFFLSVPQIIKVSSICRYCKCERLYTDLVLGECCFCLLAPNAVHQESQPALSQNNKSCQCEIPSYTEEAKTPFCQK